MYSFLSYTRGSHILPRFSSSLSLSVLSPGTRCGEVEVSGKRKNSFLSRVIFIRLGEKLTHTLAHTNRIVSLAVSSFFLISYIYIIYNNIYAIYKRLEDSGNSFVFELTFQLSKYTDAK